MRRHHLLGPRPGTQALRRRPNAAADDAVPRPRPPAVPWLRRPARRARPLLLLGTRARNLRRRGLTLSGDDAPIGDLPARSVLRAFGQCLSEPTLHPGRRLAPPRSLDEPSKLTPPYFVLRS